MQPPRTAHPPARLRSKAGAEVMAPVVVEGSWLFSLRPAGGGGGEGGSGKEDWHPRMQCVVGPARRQHGVRQRWRAPCMSRQLAAGPNYPYPVAAIATVTTLLRARAGRGGPKKLPSDHNRRTADVTSTGRLRPRTPQARHAAPFAAIAAFIEAAAAPSPCVTAEDRSATHARAIRTRSTAMVAVDVN